MKTKEELQEELNDVKHKTYAARAAKQTEIEKREKERYEPIIQQANDVKNEIYKEVSDIYKEELNELSVKETELTKAIEEINFKQAETIWYPHGTKVVKWKYPRYGSYSSKPEKSSERGTVQIYDGTQETPNNMSRYSLPKKGDIVVFYDKKDGSMGMRFDVIAEYGNIKSSHPLWLVEGETPENNIETLKTESSL